MAQHVVVFPTDTRSQNTNSKYIENYGGAVALHAVVKVNSGGNLVVAIKGNDPVSDTSYTLLTSAILASGSTVLRVGPDYTAAANIGKEYLPAEWYIEATVSGATNFSIGASMI